MGKTRNTVGLISRMAKGRVRSESGDNPGHFNPFLSRGVHAAEASNAGARTLQDACINANPVQDLHNSKDGTCKKSD